MIIAGTGHRPDKLGGYSEDNYKILVSIGEKYLKMLMPTKVISGMALGWDQALAQAAINLKIPLVAAIPFSTQDKVWSDNSKKYYRELLCKATEIINVSDTDDYKLEYMQQRNVWMVDNCDILLAMFNGTQGGTENCLKYAETRNKKIINLYPDFKETQIK